VLPVREGLRATSAETLALVKSRRADPFGGDAC
jgi:hypothetical protein